MLKRDKSRMGGAGRPGPTGDFSVCVELLEPRKLLSVAAGAVHPELARIHPAQANASPIQGATPSQIAQVYGFNNIRFSNSTIKGNGAGQTIAIVDAYSDPNIVSDLSVFDAHFGLAAPPSFKVVNQTGGSNLPVSDAGWAGEISLDVEWAHAMAPGANILLVEANSADTNQNTFAPDDLLAAVKYAASVPGVSTVSMSWGGSEFISFNGTEFTSERNYDSIFTTPAGHQGVTFVAAAGDSGYGTVEWPATSPNVLSVGGTTLAANADGTYAYETTWSSASGGYSGVEPRPAYQSNALASRHRGTPDVAYNGDPNTGYAVYDSISYQGYVGWQVDGGTSAGAPQWAALVAIADQGRALAGLNSLDGPSQTLPMLYSLYSAPGTAGYNNYTSYFNDVIDYSYFGNFPATAGYDTATGLGSPQAAALVGALTQSSSSTTSTPTTTTTPTPTPVAAQVLPASPVSAIFVKYPTSSVIGGQNASVKLLLTNNSRLAFAGPLSIEVFASTDSTIPSGATPLATLSLPQVNLGTGVSNSNKTVKLRFTWPSTMTDGSYYLIGSVNATTTDTAPSQPVTPLPFTYSQPTVDLSTTFGSAAAVTVVPGKGGYALITIENLGNVVAKGTINLTLYASFAPNLDTSVDQQLGQIPRRRISIRPNHSKTFRVRFVAPAGQTGGTYYLIASTVSSTTIADGNSANDVAAISTQ